MKSYGSIPDSLVQRPSAQHLSLVNIARFGLAAIFASALFITLSALSRVTTNSEVLLSTNLLMKSHPSADINTGIIPVRVYLVHFSYLSAKRFGLTVGYAQRISLVEEGEDAREITGPTIEDAEMFKTAGQDALATISISDISKTDLGDSCGIALYPCAKKIIGCVDSRLVKNQNGEITPLTSTCDCFVRGSTESIEIPGKQDVEFSCPLICVAGILEYTSKHVADTNIASGVKLSCDLSDLAARTFGNKYHYIPTISDSDQLELIPVDDPYALRAAEALRMNFNAARLINCPATKTYDVPGKVQYAKRGMVGDGKSQYKLEVVFGNDVVFARLAHLGESRQTVDPSTIMALDDTDNLNGRFQLMTSTPGPCEDAVPEQLAVSASGSASVNSLVLIDFFFLHKYLKPLPSLRPAFSLPTLLGDNDRSFPGK